MGASLKAHDFEVEAFNRSQTEKIVHIKKARMAREQEKRKHQSRFWTHCCSIFIVLLFALVMGSVIYKNSIINETKYEIFNLRSEIKSLNAKAEELTAKIERQTELKNIEQIAIQQLNMQYPTKEQIVYIDQKYYFTLDVDETTENSAMSQLTSSNLKTP